MKVRLVPTDVRLAPPFPIELAAVIDNDELLRVEIEWPTLQHFIEAQPITADDVHEFVRGNRHAIELAIEARVYAHGLPLAGQLVLTLEDLNRLLPIRADPAARAATGSPRPRAAGSTAGS